MTEVRKEQNEMHNNGEHDHTYQLGTLNAQQGLSCIALTVRRNPRYSNGNVYQLAGPMKAIICTHYGQPEELQLNEVPIPAPRTNQIRIRVKAAAINDHDWSLVRGKPTIYRLIFGLRRPRKPIPGMEVAGIVDAVGSDATQFKVGDAVYGDTSDHGFGSFAEHLCIDERAVILKPEHLSFVAAAAVPHALCPPTKDQSSVRWVLT